MLSGTSARDIRQFWFDWFSVCFLNIFHTFSAKYCFSTLNDFSATFTTYRHTIELSIALTNNRDEVIHPFNSISLCVGNYTTPYTVAVRLGKNAFSLNVNQEKKSTSTSAVPTIILPEIPERFVYRKSYANVNDGPSVRARTCQYCLINLKILPIFPFRYSHISRFVPNFPNYVIFCLFWFWSCIFLSFLFSYFHKIAFLVVNYSICVIRGLFNLLFFLSFCFPFWCYFINCWAVMFFKQKFIKIKKLFPFLIHTKCMGLRRTKILGIIFYLFTKITIGFRRNKIPHHIFNHGFLPLRLLQIGNWRFISFGPEKCVAYFG